MNASTRVLLGELVRYYRKLLPDGSLSLRWLWQLYLNTRRGLRGPKYVVVGDSHDPPDHRRQPNLSHIVYREGSADYELLVQRTDIRSARRVVLLADLKAANPDAETLRSLLTVVEALREGDPLDDLGSDQTSILELDELRDVADQLDDDDAEDRLVAGTAVAFEDDLTEVFGDSPARTDLPSPNGFVPGENTDAGGFGGVVGPDGEPLEDAPFRGVTAVNDP